MASRKEMLSSREKELLAKGYPAGIVTKSMDWAVGCAEGMAKYVSRISDNEDPGVSIDHLADRFLPQYLRDAETWIRSFGHEPKLS
ncbi:unnamed protein product [marine sediment metagenome]|uniref:Uncharacterized protein n=1 Tax=marine sediment metagenome TaxID=412755 RepID=X1I8L9_9ZZZZ